jgi:hypothetical protein
VIAELQFKTLSSPNHGFHESVTIISHVNDSGRGMATIRTESKPWPNPGGGRYSQTGNSTKASVAVLGETF